MSPSTPRTHYLLTRRRAEQSLVLYMIYYPQDLKYIELHADDRRDGELDRRPKITRVRTDNWSLSIILSWVVFIHM